MRIIYSSCGPKFSPISQVRFSQTAQIMPYISSRLYSHGSSKNCENKAPKVQMSRCSGMYASMQLADAYDSTYENTRSKKASKQYHGSMQAAQLWKHASSRTMHGSMQAAELWKHASSRTMEACKQQNHGSMEAAELLKQVYDQWHSAADTCCLSPLMQASWLSIFTASVAARPPMRRAHFNRTLFSHAFDLMYSNHSNNT